MTDNNNPYQAPENTDQPQVLEKHKFPLFSTLADVFIAPNKAMQEVVKSAHGWWFATILLVIAMVAPLVIYPLSMTTGEYVEMQVQVMEMQGQTVTSDVVEGIQLVAPFAVWMNLAGALIIPIMFVLAGLYYWLAGLVVAEERPKFGMAYNLAVWSSLPLIFAAVVQAANILTAGDPLMQTELDPTTLSALLGIAPTSYIGAFAAAFNPFSIWAMVIAFLGFRHLNGGGSVSSVIVTIIIPTGFTAAIAGIPFLLM